MNYSEKKNRWAVLLLSLVLFTGVEAQYTTRGDNAQVINCLNSKQADSVMSVIGENKEVVLYCGYKEEAATYMVLCDYWKEWRDGKYEVWVLGYDLHTGDTVCLPIGPSCLWVQKKR